MNKQSAILSSSDCCDSRTAEQEQAYTETSDNHSKCCVYLSSLALLSNSWLHVANLTRRMIGTVKEQSNCVEHAAQSRNFAMYHAEVTR